MSELQHPRPLRRRRRGVLLLTTALLAMAPLTARETVPVLSEATPAERSLMAGDTALFSLDLPAQHYIWIQVEQVGIDVAVAVLDPLGSVVDQIDFEKGIRRSESIEIIAEAAGLYTLRLRPANTEAQAGVVRARIGDLRPARPNDPALILAERRYNEAVGTARSRTDEALATAATRYREALALFGTADDVLGQAKTRTNLGLVLRRQGDIQGAIAEYQAALALWRQLGDARGETDSLLNLAAAHRTAGEVARAVSVGEEAVRRAREARPEAEPRMLDSLAQTLESQGAPDRALALFTRALELRQSSGDERGTARSHASLGFLYRRLGEYQQALDHLHEALAAFEQTGSPRGQMAVLNSLGGVYGALGQFQRAVTFFEQAQALSHLVGDPKTATKIHNNLGWAWHQAGDATTAIHHFETTLEGLDPNDMRTRSQVRANLGRSLLAVGDPSRARAELVRARRLARAAHDTRAEAEAVTELGHVEMAFDRPLAAADAWNVALDLAGLAHDPRTEAAARLGLAQLARMDHDWAAAQRHLEASIDVLESLRASAASARHRATFLASKRAHYRNLVDLLMARHLVDPDAGWATAALAASERARARSLADVLSGTIDPGHRVDQDAALRLRTIDRRIRTLESQRESATSEDRNAIDVAIETTLADGERLRASLSKADASLAEVFRPKAPDIATLQNLLDAETGMLVVALGPTRSFLWLVTTDAIRSHILPAEETIEGWAVQAHTAITARGERPTGESIEQRGQRIADADQSWQRSARQLTTSLLTPIADALPRRLAVVANGALAVVPFAALPLPGDAAGNEPLLSRHEVIRLPSASVLQLLRQQDANRPRAPRTLALLADPVFHDDDPRLGSVGPKSSAIEAAPVPDHPSATPAKFSNLRGERFERLPFTAREAEAIVDLLPHSRTDGSVLLVTGFEANRALVVDGHLADFRYLHFATHGIVDSQFPERSALVLSLRNRKGAPHDGFVRLADLFRLRLKADLVVLSACRTALGEAIAGEGQLSLTRGFLYAGASRVMSSLWAVQDKATRTLMTQFYSPLITEGARPAEALRHAQLSLWRSPRYQSPYYWAGFELQGDWQ